MKTIMLTLAALLALASITAQAQTGDTAYEKKSYNYAEWAKGRFSEVVTVCNPGKIIYLGGVGSEDETSAQGGAIRTCRRPDGHPSRATAHRPVPSLPLPTTKLTKGS